MNKLLLLIFLVFVNAKALPPTISWNTDLQTAIRVAKHENKKVLLYFSGSDWCKPCIKMKTFLLESPEFAAYAHDNLVLLQADFPRLKKNRLSEEQVVQNESLAEKYNPQGVFPLLLILDSEGNVLKRVEYQNQLPQEFIDQLKEA